MKTFLFKDADGNSAQVKVDIIGSGAGDNATVMDIQLILVSGTAADFYAAHPYFAGLKQMVASDSSLITLATNEEMQLTEFDSSSTSRNVTGTLLVDFPEE